MCVHLKIDSDRSHIPFAPSDAGWHLKSAGEPPLACLPSSSRGHDFATNFCAVVQVVRQLCFITRIARFFAGWCFGTFFIFHIWE